MKVAALCLSVEIVQLADRRSFCSFLFLGGCAVQKSCRFYSFTVLQPLFFVKWVDVDYLVDILHVNFVGMSILWQILAHFGTFCCLTSLKSREMVHFGRASRLLAIMGTT